MVVAQCMQCHGGRARGPQPTQGHSGVARRGKGRCAWEKWVKGDWSQSGNSIMAYFSPLWTAVKNKSRTCFARELSECTDTAKELGHIAK